MRVLVRSLAIYTLAALIGAYSLAFAFRAPKPIIAQPFFILSAVLIAASAAILFLGYVVWLAAQREPEPIARIKHDCTKLMRPHHLFEKLGPMTFAFIFLGAFGTYKSLITRIQPFYLDGFLSDLDRTMLGTDAWRITHSIVGGVGTTGLELCYRLWFVELSLTLIYFSIFATEEVKRRFFVGYMLLWSVMGFGMATVLSSAGPCFLGLIHHPYAYRYADLFPLLQPAPVAIAGQHMLAVAYSKGAAGAALGISAMPSLHVAFAAFVALACGQVNRFVGLCAWFFWALIVVGSVHLGYHYLSDGIVGTLGAALIWRATSSRTLAQTSFSGMRQWAR